jgi:hypothetical protein
LVVATMMSATASAGAIKGRRSAVSGTKMASTEVFFSGAMAAANDVAPAT